MRDGESKRTRVPLVPCEMLMQPLGGVLETYVQRQSTYTLVRLVQSFSRIESRDDRPYAPRTRLALSNRNGMWVSMTPDPLAKTVETF